MPKSESEWFKTLGSLATSGTFLYVAWLSVDDDVRSWANGQSTQAETVWWIIAAFVVFAVIAATGLAAVGWLVRSTVQELRHRKKSVS
jgi:purine-cytosine permease-like protein